MPNQNLSKSKLFVCASCEWIFKDNRNGCPKCGFVYYGAHYCYGSKAYTYFKTQEKWLDKKLATVKYQLQKQIETTTEYKPKSNKFNF